jgi:hypothetical protein
LQFGDRERLGALLEDLGGGFRDERAAALLH